MEHNVPEMVILRGIPGSGKSHWVMDNNPDPFRSGKKKKSTICSADHYFIKDNVYTYNRAESGESHKACLLSAISAINDRRDVIIDNTNINVEDIAPYYALATAYDYRVKIVTVVTTDPVACWKRNKHGVPLASIIGMYQAMMRNGLPFRWVHEMVPAEF